MGNLTEAVSWIYPWDANKWINIPSARNTKHLDLCIIHSKPPIRDDNGAGPKDGVFVLALLRMTEKTFSSHPRPSGPHEVSLHLEKLYFLLICSTTGTIFLMKPISLIRIYLKL